jgi:hypothetical protein
MSHKFALKLDTNEQKLTTERNNNPFGEKQAE